MTATIFRVPVCQVVLDLHANGKQLPDFASVMPNTFH